MILHSPYISFLIDPRAHTEPRMLVVKKHIGAPPEITLSRKALTKASPERWPLICQASNEADHDRQEQEWADEAIHTIYLFSEVSLLLKK